MSAINEKKINAANRGRMTSIAWQTFEPLFSARKLAHVLLLMQEYRSGKKPDELYKHIASLVALDDFETDVRMTVHRGQQAAKEVLNG